GRLHLAFYRLVEYLSDEERRSTSVPGPTLALDVKRLMLRKFERKPLSSYYRYRARSGAVVVVDNSGSMSWLEDALSEVFSAAARRRDVEIYIAPNGHIEAKYDGRRVVEVDHEVAMTSIRRSGLPVIYFGDYDGANTPIMLSWTSRVFWVCPETRYLRFREHDWVEYDEESYKGFFARARNAAEVLHALEEFARGVTRTTLWIDPGLGDEDDPSPEE
ncbi:MAG: hypothetical protein ACP5RJ_07350, partial [Conexivisphaera sp.]